MGIGYTYKCKCKSPEPICLGVGMGYPLLCQETWEEMASGKYGASAQRYTEKYPNGGLDCEYQLYTCGCGHWEVDTKKTMYERGGPDHSDKRCNLVHLFFHVCPECGKRMGIANPKNANLTCQKCGETMTDFFPSVRWD